MNARRRKEIAKVIEDLQSLSADVERLHDEEEEAYDNLPEGLQCSIKGDTIEENVSNLADALDSIEETINALTEAMENYE